MRSVLGLCLAFALFAALPAAAPAASAAAFDPARIHADYQAGEFEKVIRALEAFRESGRRCRKPDSVFLEKHLAVVYAADPKTRERGRYHMMRMLSLEPEADLLDMFVGEEVDGIFEKVSKESRARRLAVAKAHAGQAAQAAKAPKVAASRPAVPAGVPRPAFPEAGPAPRLKPWNLDEAPAPRRAPRKPEASRAAAIREADAALPAWDLDRTAASGPAMGVLPAAMAMPPFDRVRASVAKPAALRLRPGQALNLAASEADQAAAEKAESADRLAADTASGPRWTGKRFLVGGTAVAAVLGLTAYYLGSQDWSEPASRNRTYGVAAKPNGN